MTHPLRVVAILLGPSLLAACSGSGEQRTARLLDNRLQSTLAPDIASGRAVLQQTSNGARVTVLDPALFRNTKDVLDNRESDIRANLIEGLLDPALMRIQIADTSTMPDDEREVRVSNVMRYFTAYGLGPTLQPTDPLQPAPPSSTGAAVGGLTITIGVQCPHYPHRSFYSDGARPSCD